MSKIIATPYQGALNILVPKDMVEEFKLLVARGISTWQDPSVAMVKFCDEIKGQAKIMAPTYKDKENE